MKNALIFIAATLALPALGADSILVGEYTLAKEKEGCATNIIIKQAEKCFEVTVDANQVSLCRVNRGPLTKKLKTLQADRETSQAYKTTNVIKLGNVLTEYTTTSIKNKFYQTVTRTFETTSFTATKDRLFYTNSVSKMALAPNGSTLRCQYSRVAE